MPSFLAKAGLDGTGMVRVRSVRGAMGSRLATRRFFLRWQQGLPPAVRVALLRILSTGSR